MLQTNIANDAVDEVNINHVRLEDDDYTEPTHNIADDHSTNHRSNNLQKWSSIVCHIIPLALLMFIYAVIDSALFLLIPLYANSQLVSNENASEAISGLIVAFAGTGLVITSPFVGYLISATSTEFCAMTAAIVRTLVLLVIFLYSQSIVLWCIIALFYGASVTGNAICVNHFMSKSIKSEKRGRSTAIINGMRRLGSTIGPLFAGHIAQHYISLLIMISVSLTSILVVCCLMLPPNVSIPRHENEDIAVDMNGSFIYFKYSYKKTFKQKWNIRNWVKTRPETNGIDGTSQSDSNDQHRKAKTDKLYVWKQYGKLLVFVGLFGFSLRWVRSTRKLLLTFHGLDLGLSNAQIGTINSVSFFPDTLMFPIAGYLMDKYGRKATAVPGLVLFVISLIFIGFTRDFAGLICIGILFGFADGITAGLLMTAAADLAPNECKSEFIAQFRMFTNLPEVLAPIIVGTLCSNVSLLSAAMSSAAIGFIGFIWIAFILQEPKHTAQQSENMLSAATNINVELDVQETANQDRSPQSIKFESLNTFDNISQDQE